MIEISDLQVVFGKNTPLEKEALRGVGFKMAPGEFITVVGSNGSGKSTLFNSIAGDVIPDRGSIKIDGLEVIHLAAHQRAHLLGRMFQDPSVGSCADLTIAENMALARKRGARRGLWHCLSTESMAEFGRSLAGLGTGLENRLNVPMRSLSGGQRQAVSLIMATLSPLKILLLDEPTAALDPKAEATVLSLIVKVAAEKKMTVLMVTHSLKHALTLGTRTLVLKEGQLVQDFSGEARRSLHVGELAELLDA